MQAPSTRHALSQSEAERKAHRLAPIPNEAQCIKEDGSVDLNIRMITKEEEKAEQSLRYGRGAVIERVIAEERRAASVEPRPEVRERATKAFMGGFTVKAVREQFKKIFGELFKPTHAEIVAQEMKKGLKNDK